MQTSLTKGPVTRSLLRFAAPMIAGNLLQQVYNVADTLIVGRFLGGRGVVCGDGVPDLGGAGAVHGQRDAVFDAVRRGRHRRDEAQHGAVLRVHRRGGAAY